MTEQNHERRGRCPSVAVPRDLLDTVPVAMCYVADSRLTWINRSMSEMFGYNGKDPLLGKPLEDLFSCPEERDRLRGFLIDGLNSAGVREADARLKRRDGSVFTANLQASAVNPGEGDSTDAWLVVRGSRPTLGERGLIQSEMRYRNLVEGSFDGIFLRQENKIIFANSRLSEMLDYNVKELEALDRWDIYHPDDRRTVQERTEARLRGERVASRYDVRLRRRDGSSFPAELDARVFKWEGEPLMQVCVRDISERKRAEEERLHLVTAIEQAAEIIVIADTEGKIGYVNPAIEAATGFKREEIVGSDLRLLTSAAPARDKGGDLLRHLSSGNVWSGRIVNRKKDGTDFEAEITVSPVRGENDDIVSHVAVMRDVTNEVALENQLRHAAKMEALGTLAGGIAHDFNNMLFVIMGYAELALEDFSGDERHVFHLRQVLRGASRAKELVDRILTFSRQSERCKKNVSVAPIVNEALTFIRASIPTTIEIKRSVQALRDTIHADPAHIHQIIMNLCSNAAHAMRHKGGLLDVVLADEDFCPDSRMPLAGMVPGPYLRLSVRDTGHGMGRDVLERIFEPYFSTKEKGQGTGLGLAVVHGIVKELGGAITVDSEPEKGTVFCVYLPVVRADPASSETEDEPHQVAGMRVLVVDDERTVVEILREMLQILGNAVETTTSSTEALELFRTRPFEFDLVISDMTMPGLTGMKLAEEIRKIRGDIPIVLCTGYSELMTPDEAAQLGIAEVLRKPVALRQLNQTLQMAFSDIGAA